MSAKPARFRRTTTQVENSNFDLHLQAQLAGLEEQHLLRRLSSAPESCVSFCENDYLGLTSDPRIVEFAAQYATGGGASRLVGGNHELYTQLEAKLAEMKDTEAALVFSSGFAMNSSVIPALAGKGDLILADRLCHASLIEGMRTSEASYRRYPHNDLEALEALLQTQRGKYRHGFIITESVFSMDGDRADIEALTKLADHYDCQLLVDDAHGFGVLSSLPVHPRLIQLGTLSKAVGSLGGYICGSKILVDYLSNRAKALIYSTALPPMVLAASLKALEIMELENWRSQKAMDYASQFCDRLSLSSPQSLIVPMILGESEKCLYAAQSLQQKGYHVAAIRTPTVPQGTARLRFTFSAKHTPEQVVGLIQTVKEVC